MKWLRDTSQAKLNDWHICFNVINGTKFCAMPVLLDKKVIWLIDPWCRERKDQLIVQVTHFMHFPENPI